MEHQYGFDTVSPDGAEELSCFYRHVIDSTPGMELHTRWVWGLHPTREMLEGYIRSGAMVRLHQDGKTVGALAMPKGLNEDYLGIDWRVKADWEDVYILNILAIAPELQGRGLGRLLLEKTVQAVREKGGKVIRLDTFLVNLPAQKLYERFGFYCCGGKRMETRNSAWMDFLFYEYDMSIIHS